MSYVTLPIFATLLFLAAGCTKEGTAAPEPDRQTDPVEIVPGGGIAPSVVSEQHLAGVPSDTRAVINAEHAELQVSFARLDQQEGDGSYAAYTTLSTALPASMAATTGDPSTPALITFDTPQYYLSRETNNNTKLLGWYPQADPAAGVVTLTIDGENDIMLSQELEGNKESATRFGAAGKIFQFDHCLTQLKFKAYAADDAAPTVWGNITAIKIKDQANSCKITLPASVAFEGTADLSLPAKNWDGDAPISYPLAFSKVEASAAAACGYAMIQPVDAGGSLAIVVTTQQGGDYQTDVTVPAAGFEKGKAYEIVLKFTSTTIEPTATVTDWVDADAPIEVEM